MADNIVVYGKQSGEPYCPVTIRIEWMPDGTIKPLMYWTPDCTCYEVISSSSCVSLAFLKERSEGLRFKVRVEITETPDPDDELLHSRYDTYLYLADKRFSEKNIIDGRYGHAGKEYIPVIMDVFPNGDYELVYFMVHGERYRVEKTREIRPRGSFQAGGVGIRHKVEARMVNADDDEDKGTCVRRDAALYWELNKWFVTLKT